LEPLAPVRAQGQKAGQAGPGIITSSTPIYQSLRLFALMTGWFICTQCDTRSTPMPALVILNGSEGSVVDEHYLALSWHKIPACLWQGSRRNRRTHVSAHLLSRCLQSQVPQQWLQGQLGKHYRQGTIREIWYNDPK